MAVGTLLRSLSRRFDMKVAILGLRGFRNLGFREANRLQVLAPSTTFNEAVGSFEPNPSNLPIPATGFAEGRLLMGRHLWTKPFRAKSKPVPDP